MSAWKRLSKSEKERLAQFQRAAMNTSAVARSIFVAGRQVLGWEEEGVTKIHRAKILITHRHYMAVWLKKANY